jgi:hypothetical protein
MEVTNTCNVVSNIGELNKVKRHAFPFLRWSSFNPVAICLAPVHRDEKQFTVNMH